MENTSAAPMDTSGVVDTGIEGNETSDLGFDENDPSSYLELEDGKDERGQTKTRRISIAEAKKLAMKGYGADQRFQEAAAQAKEAAAVRQQMAQLARMFQEDPWQVLEAFGKNPNELIQARFQRELEEAMMDPRDKELKTKNARLEELERAEQARQEQMFEQQVAEQAAQYQDMLFNKIDSALKISGVPNTPETVAEIGRYLQVLHGKTDSTGRPVDIFKVPVEALVRHVKTKFNTNISSMYKELDGDELLNSFDPVIIKKIMNAQTKKYQEAGIMPKQNKPMGNIQGSKQPSERKTQAEIEMEHKNFIQNLDEQWRKKNKKF